MRHTNSDSLRHQRAKERMARKTDTEELSASLAHPAAQGLKMVP